MVSLTTVTVRMAESSGDEPGTPTPGKSAGIQQVACIFCRAPLPSPTAPFCTHCGHPQKKCINSQCGGPVQPGAPFCPYCWTPQQQGAGKKCINPQCGVVLHPVAMYCNVCSAPQDPVIYQQLMSVPNCVSCSTKLLKPDQKICHECGAPQPTQTSVVHGGQQPLPHGSQPSYYFHPSYTHVPSPSLYISQPSQVPQPHVPQATPYPHYSQPSLQVPQATSPQVPKVTSPQAPQETPPPLPQVPQATPPLLPQVPQATPPPLPPVPQAIPPPFPQVPQATPHPYSTHLHQPSVPPSDSTLQEQTLSSAKCSPDTSDTSNSTHKRSQIEVGAGQYFMITFWNNLCAVVVICITEL